MDIFFATRHRQNFIAFMSLTDEDIEKVGHANVLELTKNIWFIFCVKIN